MLTTSCAVVSAPTSPASPATTTSIAIQCQGRSRLLSGGRELCGGRNVTFE